MAPWADHRRAAVIPRMAPAKMRNHRVPCVWKLRSHNKKYENSIGSVNRWRDYLPPQRTDVKCVAERTNEESKSWTQHCK